MAASVTSSSIPSSSPPPVLTEQQMTTVHNRREPTPDVPLFLRKTYAMISSCDTEIACWDEDGTTFVVKQPEKFEQTVIPQFFKHSKFTSFVRQLNFYSFRKIKLTDSVLRIDPELEKRTANHWRFRHEFFRRDQPELLSKMKRVNSSSNSSTNTNTNTTPSATAASTSSSLSLPNNNNNKHNNKNTPTEVAQKSEVLKLQQKIEEMTKNMDALTEMVQKVSLQQQQQQQQGPPAENNHIKNNNNNKRKKTEAVVMDMPDPMLSNMMMMDLDTTAMHDTDDDLLPIPDIATSNDLPLPTIPLPESIVGSSVSTLTSTNPIFGRQNSNASTDSDFVDQIFSAFHNDEEFLDLECHSDMNMAIMTQPTAMLADTSAKNRPDPELMQRLGEALELLPKSTQELIINRLIDAILNTEGLHLQGTADKDMPPQTTTTTTTKHMPPLVVDETATTTTTTTTTAAPKPLGLAAATFQALLEHYSSQNNTNEASTKQSKHARGKQQHPKSIPVIPVHA